MEIERWMKKPARTVKPRESILHAREIMAEHRINQLPVVADGRVVGIVTDRDLRDAFPSAFEPPRRGGDRRAAPDPREVPVDAVMTQTVLTLGPRDSLASAARLMGGVQELLRVAHWKEIERMRNSLSWRVTAPLRSLGTRVRARRAR